MRSTHLTVTLLVAGALSLLLAACGGYGGSSSSVGGNGCGGGYGGGTCPPPTITMNSPGSTVNRTVALTASAAAMGSATVTRVDFMIDGTVVGTATAVTINEACAGSTGASVITLAANAGIAGEWDVPAGALLTADQVTALLEGKLYVIVTSAANASGELRGQIAPANISVSFASLDGTQEVPSVTIGASGVAATTVDSAANTVSVHVNTTGVNDATAAEVDTAATGATGPKLVALTKDSVNTGHWSIELASISATDVGNYTAGKWYVNVVTPADPNGAIRGQVNATVAPPPAAPTLTQLKSTAFAVCSGCHTGGGTSLPASMDLHPAQIYASIVNVASVEQPSLKRVAPGDATNSYVVQKLEGAATITGSRMPLGGPFLDQATIDQVKAWINAGAQNN